LRREQCTRIIEKASFGPKSFAIGKFFKKKSIGNVSKVVKKNLFNKKVGVAAP